MDFIDEVLAMVDACERAGFRLGVRHEWKLRPDGRRSNEILEHLSVWDPEDPGRRASDDLVLPLMRHARVVRGYLRRIRSPFYPASPTRAVRRTAVGCAMADDARLREHGR